MVQHVYLTSIENCVEERFELLLSFLIGRDIEVRLKQWRELQEKSAEESYEFSLLNRREMNNHRMKFSFVPNGQ